MRAQKHHYFMQGKSLVLENSTMRRAVFAVSLTAILGMTVLTAFDGSTATASGAVQSASRIFASKCAGCHAPDGSGNITGTPNFTDAGWQGSRSDAELTASIKNGKGKVMPAWGGKLSDAQISGLVAHVRSLKK